MTTTFTDSSVDASVPEGYWLHQFTVTGVGRMSYAIRTGMKPEQVGCVARSTLFGSKWLPYEASDVWVWMPDEGGWTRPGYLATVESWLRRDRSYTGEK